MTEFSQTSDLHQTTDPGCSENTKHEKHQKIYIQAYTIQMAQNQNKEKAPEGSQRKQSPHL